TTVLPGAGPDQIETEITKPIEDAINTIGGIDNIQSTSQEGVSIVIVQFHLNVNGVTAAQEVRDKVANIEAQFPDGTKTPVVQRYDPASQPILILAVSGPGTEKEVTNYTKYTIKPRIENVENVGSVDLVGGAEREIRVEVDPNKMQAYNLSIQDVINAVSASNVEIPAGNLIKGDRQLLLRTMGKFKTVDDFNKVVVAAPRNQLVYLSDIAEVIDGVKQQTSLTRLNGRTAVGMQILKESGTNTVRVANAVKQEVARLNSQMPPGYHIAVAIDYSIFIRESVNDVLFDIIYGGFLAILIIFFFLAYIRSTIISAISLPTSIIASIFFMYIFNFTLNVMSLMALSLAVGFLIDDAIVVIENIYRHMQLGESPRQAAHNATDEIGLAVMATTFTIVAVFVPVAFMPGIIGRFFFQFGITVTAAVLVSLFVAFSFTPMLSSRWLGKEDEELHKGGNIVQKILYYFRRMFEKLNDRYRGALGWSLSHRKTVLFGSVGIFIFSLYLGKYVGSTFFPEEDQGQLSVAVKAAPGSSLEQTADICKIVEHAADQRRPAVQLVLTTVGQGNNPVTEGTVYIKLVNKSKRQKSVFHIMDEMRRELRFVSGANLSFNLPGGPGGQQKPVQITVRGENLDTLQVLADKIEKIVQTTSGAVDVENSLQLSQPEVRIHVDRNKASDLGINPLLVASTVRSMVDGTVATQFQGENEQYDVRVNLMKKDRSNILDVSNFFIKSSHVTPDGQKLIVPLSTVAAITPGTGPSEIDRYNRQRSITVSANLLGGALLGNVIGNIQSGMNKIKVPPGYNMKVIGQGETQAQSFGDIFLALALAMIFVYIVLAAQFESFVYPLSIMLALPMAVVGAILALLISNSAFSVMSMIGIIMLMGLATKNGILLVDYINTNRGRGLERRDAIMEAGPVRLRPILMTTFAIIFGMLPIVFALGQGSEFRAPMGQAVIGGLISSTLL
ncbi:MAG: efflux RND transporter permease subunit, partial [Calditrichia bacterium]